MKKVEVTDHALLRYLERKYSIDVEALRREIAKEVECAVIMGATYFHEGSTKFCFAKRPDGGYAVTTVLHRSMNVLTKRVA